MTTIRSRLKRLERDSAQRRDALARVRHYNLATDSELNEREEPRASVDANGEHVLVMDGKEQRYPSREAMDEFTRISFDIFSPQPPLERLMALLNARPWEESAFELSIEEQMDGLEYANNNDESVVLDPIARMEEALLRYMPARYSRLVDEDGD